MHDQTDTVFIENRPRTIITEAVSLFTQITNKDPYIVEGLKHSGDQTKGACLVPKRAMDVMQGEVNRVLQLCDSSIVPITWQVPRKVRKLE